MGGVNDRGGKPTKKFDSSELARLTAPGPLDDADEALREWTDEPSSTPHAHAKPIIAQGSRVAAGTAPPAADLQRSRTATVHDPFTTGLLAEVARRSQTAELSPEQVKQALEQDEDEDDDKTPPVVSPRIIKR